MAHGSVSRPLNTRWSRIVAAHDRLLLSVVIGLVAFVALLGLDWRMPTRMLAAWDFGILVYLTQALVTINRFDLNRVRRRAAIQDEGGGVILVLTVLATAASIAAIIAELAPVKDSQDPGKFLPLGLAVVTIVLSWMFIQTMFAFHYAYEFYGEGHDGNAGGLDFPKDNQPEYWDFVYFSFVIGMTFQVSDVQITSKPIRRIALAQGFVSFIFNVAIVALMVNIGANVI